jgi:hypothetical protein
VGVAFGWLGVEDPSQWETGIVLYVLGCMYPILYRSSIFYFFDTDYNDTVIAYQCALTFWTAAFPGLARDLPSTQASLRAAQNGEKTMKEHAEVESMERNRISNVSFAVCSAGEILILAVMVGIVKALKAGESSEGNTRAFSVLCAFSGGVWCKCVDFLLEICIEKIFLIVLCAIPWFVLEQRRPGLTLPPGTSLLTVGFKQTAVAFRECVRLKQTFLYLVFYFLM